MEYIIILLEGIITFISPCMLPMLPIYISYFAGQETSKKNTLKTVCNAISFVLGFTLVFTTLGVFSASVGMILKSNIKIVNVMLGIIVIIFGLDFMDVIKLGILNKSRGIKVERSKMQLISSFIFGIIFSITWTPCVGAFLGTALSIITISGNIAKGLFLIITYCIGLGFPFVISAIFIDKLKNVFNGIKKHYGLINKICGIFLCGIGILMITGLIDKYFNLLM